jgi:malonyl-CoA O-methyltransferase
MAGDKQIAMKAVQYNNSTVSKQLAVERYCSYAVSAPAILLIHGWASSSAIWVDVLDQLRQQFDVYTLDLPGVGKNRSLHCKTLDQLLDLFGRDVHPLLPPKYALVGWSLGGVVATLIGRRFSKSVSAQVAISSSPQFVQSNVWQHGMNAEIFNQFKAGVGSDTTRYLKRFRVLQTLDAPTAKDDCKWLDTNSQQSKSEPLEQLQLGLQWLSQTQLHDLWLNPLQPVLYQYGAHDALVPASLAKHIHQQASNDVGVEVFDNSAHLPFCSEQERWLESTQQFLLRHLQTDLVTSGKANLDKKAIANAFSKAAVSYDCRAAFQHNLADTLVKTVAPFLGARNTRILDLGSGTGYAQTALKTLAGESAVVALDLAQGMLNYSKAKNSETLHVLADIENLPFSNAGFELIYANLSLQWCSNYAAIFEAIRNCLSNEGYCAFTTLLPGSLPELKEASACIGRGAHINEFVGVEKIAAAFNDEKFIPRKWTVSSEQYFYSDVAQLLKSVRGIGAGNHRSDRDNKLTGKRHYHAFIAALENQRQGDKGIPLSYRVLTAVLQRAQR